jgi:hypothetical protein
LTPFPAHHLICPSCQCAAGLFACDGGQITGTFPRVFCPHEGRFAIVTNVGRKMRWTQWRARRARRLRTAKSWRPDISTLVSTRANASHCAGMVARKPDHQGDHEISRKTIARGMPECFGEPAVTCLRAFFILHARLRVR